MVEFGEKLKKLREEKGITQQTLADQLYVTRQAVSRWECGARYPDLLTAKKIAEGLDTTIDELVSGEECRRDVEKEPVLAAPKYWLIQIALYGLVVAPYVILFLFSVKGFFPDEALRGTPAGELTASTYLSALERLTKLIAMGFGLYFAVRNELTPFKIGIIMSTPFWGKALLLGEGYVREIIRGNETIGLLWPDVIWQIAAAAGIIFFFSKKGMKHRIYNILFPIFIGVIALSEMLGQAQMLRRTMIYYTELGFVVRIAGVVGETVFMVLLVFQALSLFGKRSINTMKKI